MKKKIVLIILISIVLCATPLLSAHSYSETINHRTEMQREDDTSPISAAEIYCYSYQPGNMSATKKVVPISEALLFVSTISTKDESLQDAYQILAYPEEMISFQKSSYNADTMGLQTCAFIDTLKNIESLPSIGSFNFFCTLNCKLFGLGLVLGSHSMVPTIGADLLGIFASIGMIDMTGGFLDDVHLSGFHLWGYLGFVGNLVLTIIPMFPGPIILINGIAIVCFSL